MRYTPAIAITILAAVTAAAGAPTPAPGVGAPGPVISYFALRRHKGVGGHSRRPKRDVAAQDGAKKWVRDDTGDASDDDPDDFLDSRALAVKEAEARRDDDTGDASSNDDPNDFFDFGSRALAVKEAEVRRDDSTGDGGDEDPNDFLDLDSRALNDADKAAPALHSGVTSEENKRETSLAADLSAKDEGNEQAIPEAELVEQPEASSMDCYYQLVEEFMNDGGLEN